MSKEAIKIRDIFITSPQHQCWGEFSNVTNIAKNRAQRIVKDIAIIASLGNTLHISQHCEVDGQIKTGHENNITRISLPEFSFYTHGTPLSLHEFIEIKKKVYHMATRLSPNLHLVLASFPLAISCGQLQNTLFYVQCGPKTEIRSFNKVTQSDIDPEYKNYEYHDEDIEDKGGVFRFKTHGKTSAWIAIDVCVEHNNGIAKQKLQQLLLSNKRLQNQPCPVSHMIISNSTTIDHQHLIANTFVHVDSNILHHTGQWRLENQRSRPITERNANTIIANTFDFQALTNVGIQLSLLGRDMITINNTAFGGGLLYLTIGALQELPNITL